jgi:F-type H+-transporting ATPase subunit alpha
MPVEEQVAILWAATNGFLDDVPVERVHEFEQQYLEYMRTSQMALLQRIADEKQLTDEIVEALRTATEQFKRAIWSAPVPVAAR